MFPRPLDAIVTFAVNLGGGGHYEATSARCAHGGGVSAMPSMRLRGSK